ncbi:DUF4011 domain-containing protein [Cryobacterium sandaracinum]|nr:DUF4011 domain-containing protein [Cryobacterium sandaracinum]
MDLTNREYVARALELVVDGLGPFVSAALTPIVPQGKTWVTLLEEKDRHNRILGKTYSPKDLQSLLRVITERLDPVGYPFADMLPREAQRLASELRDVRNSWAHGGEFDNNDAYRAIDSAERLLALVDATEQAGAAAELKLAVAPARPNPAEETVVIPKHGAQETPAASQVAGPASPVMSATYEIELSATPILSYALAHNRQAVVSELTITNHGPELREAVLRLEVTSALGSLGSPREILVELGAGRPSSFTELGLLMDPAVMLTVEEQRPAVIRARLLVAGDTVAEKSVEVQLLAAHQWVSRPVELALEMLAAHVQPNHPAIAPLLSEASDILEHDTGSGSLQGYQAGPDRVDEIVAAVFEAMRNRAIRYSNPPASWADVGQKVRNPAEVLEGRVGTCLDTTVVFAAALEQAGINPLLWVVDGHAFVGYWREEDRSLGAPATTDATEVVNLVDLELIKLVETTMLTTELTESTFAQSQRSPYVSQLSGNLENVIGVTDVVQARKNQIIPLPARTQDDSGTIIVTEYHPHTPDMPTPPHAGAPAGTMKDRPGRVVPYRVEQWKNALLDLSLRNRLINFTDRGRLPLVVADRYLASIEDLIVNGTGLTLLPSDQVASIDRQRGIRFGRDLPQDQLALLLQDKKSVYADVTDAAYTTRLRALAYKARTVVQETGANNLYLAFGTLVWNVKGRELRSPLVLVPVTLETTNRAGSYRVVLDEAGQSTPNYCLLEKLRQEDGLSIPGLEKPVEGASGIDLEAALRATREAIVAAKLHYRVESTLDLAILQFAKFRLWKDLDENWETLAENSLVNHLIYTPTEAFADPVPPPPLADLDALGAECPVPGDSSQLAAVAEAVANRTFVLEGPPGTGKSQTITNLLTRAVADGKRVLFVAEKRAALQVVQKRLEEVGMGAFALDLHDKASKPVAVRAQIRAALEHRVTVDGQGLKNDLEALATARGSLARYASRLHDENPAGLSYYSARTQALSSAQDVAAMSVPSDLPGHVTADVLDDVRRVFRNLPDVAEPARARPEHPWAFLTEPPVPSLDIERVRAASLEMDAAVKDLPADGTVAGVLTHTVTAPEFTALATLATSPRLPLSVLEATVASEWRDAERDAMAAVTAFIAGYQAALDVVTPAAFQLDTTSVHAAATAADASGFFGRKKRRLAALQMLDGVLVEGVVIPLKSLSEVTRQLVAAQSKLDEVRVLVRSVDGVTIPGEWNPLLAPDVEVLSRQLNWLRWVGSVLTPSTSPHGEAFTVALRAYYSDAGANVSPKLRAAVTRCGTAVEELISALGVTPQPLVKWSGHIGFIAAWRRTAPERDALDPQMHSLRRWVDLLEHLAPLTAAGLSEARTSILAGTTELVDASRAFEKGLAIASIGERAHATALDQFETVAHNRSITRFTDSSRAVREHLPSYIPFTVLGQRTFGATASTGQIGLLKRQLDRQRGGMGVRDLMRNFGDLITQIMPCMLMSPESVARFFPAQAGLFDIIVFDEASQVRVADAIGAMGRAKSVVVVGDSKQMPPSSFGESSIGSADDDSGAMEFVRDEESILSECVQSQVPSKWLSWHYRSQDESLISYSNRAYYRDRLSSFPAPIHTSGNNGIAGYGVSLERVNGQFLRSGTGKALRTNPVEAEAVVDEIIRRFWASPLVVPSIGVVTFNMQQRTLIETRLRDSGDDRIVQALDNDTDGLFVKNLENVQGDERDTILFSTAFSANDRGYLPLNFGPLNLPGGERRLNVAITRARRQVIVFSSFNPKDLRAEETTSVGIKHFKAYLEMAEKGGDAAAGSTRISTAIDRHREDIAEGLRERGLTVTTDVGLSDFRIDLSVAEQGDPGKPIMAVLLDGPGWAARRTVSDRDGLPVEVLSKLMRWPAVERIWMPEWLSSRDSVLDRLTQTLAAAAKASQTETPEEPMAMALHAQTPPSLGASPSTTERKLASALSPTYRSHALAGPPPSLNAERFDPYQVRYLGQTGVLDALPRLQAAASVSTALRAIVDAEGPIHYVRLTKLLALGFGLERVNATRMQSILRHLPEELKAQDEKPFAWPARLDPRTWRGFRPTPGGVARPLEHISPRELVNAMVEICHTSAGMNEVELMRETLNMFGGTSLTTKSRDLLSAALLTGQNNGRLERTQNGVYLAANP